MQPSHPKQKSRFSLRRELRIALLAAMETCWIFAAIEFLAGMAGITHPPLTPLPFFLAYWFAMGVGRALPQSRSRWLVLQSLAMGIVILTVLAVARVEAYPDLNWYDLTWLPRFVPALLTFAHGVAVEQIATAGVIYVFIRGLGFAQRPLTLWFVGFQFRLGILMFFVLLVVAGLTRVFSVTQRMAYDATPWIFFYFFISLLAIALARIDESGSDMPLGPQWAVTLIAAVVLVLFLGLGILQFFTLDTATFLVRLLTPLGWLATMIILFLAIPFGFLLQWLIDILRPLFQNFSRILEALMPLSQNELQENAQKLQDVLAPTLLIPLLKVLLGLTVLLIVGYFLARALNRRMMQIEEDVYEREALGLDDEAALQARRASMTKQAKPRPRARHVGADSIRRIYAALVAFAAEAGLARQVAETPYEFLPRLEGQWHPEAEDLRTITEAYVDVHYAEHDALPEQVNRVREAWERIQRRTK